MKVKSVTITNFRGIEKLDSAIEFSDLNFLVGDNGSGKTTILEAINFCLSPSFAASRLDINDFHNGTENLLEITVELAEAFTAEVPDGYGTQDVLCNRVRLRAKKRDRAAPGKAFSGLVTAAHYVVPVAEKVGDGWSQRRKTGTDFSFSERQLTFGSVTANLPKVFYFSKTRTRQLAKGFSSTFSNILEDLNWRFDKAQREHPPEDHFRHQRDALHERVFQDTVGDTLKKTIEAANVILAKLGIAPVSMSLIKTLSP